MENLNRTMKNEKQKKQKWKLKAEKIKNEQGQLPLYMLGLGTIF